MKNVLLALLFFHALGAAAQSPQCFYQTAANTYANSYLGNDVTHDNTHVPRTSEAEGTLVQFGRNGFILDGPAFYVGTECTTSYVTFYLASQLYEDTYHQHCVCTSGPSAGQGCTSIVNGVGTAGSCPGGSGTLYDNMYDVGLYCIGGSCTFGQLYAHSGPMEYSSIIKGVDSFRWQEGTVSLPVGSYAVGMGTNCDSGSVAGQTGIVSTAGGNSLVNWVSGAQFNVSGTWNNMPIYIGNPTYQYTIQTVNNSEQLTLTTKVNQMTNVPYVQGATPGGGGGKCAQAMGEGNGYGAGGSGGGWVGATQLFSFKVFVTDHYHADCLLYDPYHDNTVGLPDALAAYDSSTKGCTYVDNPNTGIDPLSPYGQAPHLVDFAIN